MRRIVNVSKWFFMLFFILLLVGLLVAQITNIKSNNEFTADVKAIMLEIKVPAGSKLLRENVKKQGALDIGVSTTYSVTYSLEGYSRQEVAALFSSKNDPEQKIEFTSHGRIVQVFLWPAPDWNRMNELGRESFQAELAKKPVKEFSITIH